MLTSLVIAAISFQVQTNLPKIVYEMPIVGGQREIILGPKPIEPIVLNGFYEHEYAGRHLATPGNTGDYVDSWQPGGTDEESLGYFDCTVKRDALFEKPCILITTMAKWNQKIGPERRQIKWQNFAKQQYWVTSEGTILRHYLSLNTPEGTQTGDCTYGTDSIERRYTDVKGKTSFGEVFPSCGMDLLNAQFKPMIADGKLLSRDKQFAVLNPLTGGIDKYTAYPSGTFRGTFLNATFKGRLFTIEGPNHTSQKVFLDDSGDLVKVMLTDEKFFVISVVPKSHLDEYGRPIEKKGGG